MLKDRYKMLLHKFFESYSNQEHVLLHEANNETNRNQEHVLLHETNNELLFHTFFES